MALSYGSFDTGSEDDLTERSRLKNRKLRILHDKAVAQTTLRSERTTKVLDICIAGNIEKEDAINLLDLAH